MKVGFCVFSEPYNKYTPQSLGSESKPLLFSMKRDGHWFHYELNSAWKDSLAALCKSVEMTVCAVCLLLQECRNTVVVNIKQAQNSLLKTILATLRWKNNKEAVRNIKYHMLWL